MDLSARGLARRVEQAQAGARNALEVARFGGLDTGEESSPSRLEHEHPVYRLRRYYPDLRPAGAAPPIVLVPPMMLAADVFDVSPPTSAVRILAEHGVDPWVVDFGAPEHEEGGLERTLTDHLLAVSDAVDQVRARTGRDVHLSGYSQGGMWCYQVAALRRSAGLASVITYGSPVDTQALIPIGLPDEAVAGVLTFLADHVLARQSLPGWASRIGFRLLDPVSSVRQRLDFFRQLHDRDALLPRERQRRFLQNEGWVAWPGPALAELIKQTVAHNRMVSGGFVIDDQSVTLADLTCPVLAFVGTVDEIARPKGVRAIARAAPLADVHEVTLSAGHFGLVVGSTAAETTWPTAAAWIHWREGEGERPAAIVDLDGDAEQPDDDGNVLLQSAELAANLGLASAQLLATGTSRSLRTMRGLAVEVREQLPRIARLERTHPGSRISIGLLLEEQTKRAPEDTVFLFEGRGHTYAAANQRIDNVVRGLISLGVHHGEHVGVLMATRPSALTVVAALNRIGAVAVLLRPDGPIEREVELGQLARVVADPERADAVTAVEGVQVLVLGGGGQPRTLSADVVDMERIDPDEVVLPGWYRPNPGRARDLAFILFTGSGERTRPNRITNARWALSAFGTASAAALSSADTVYGVTPIHHPSGLLTSVGGAVAGGARLAMATSFDPDTFWDEVRRYGVTVVAYTWSQVQPLVHAPPHPLEQHHPVRLFLGSGMPSGLWRRVNERFAPARVLEFYASTEGRAVLVNLTGDKPGSKGRPLPGSAEVRLARYDLDAGMLVTGPDGFAVPCDRGEMGMLLARADVAGAMSMGSPLRGVFAREDAWIVTGDLFRRDGDGDFWHLADVASPAGLVRTAKAIVATIPIEDALQTIPAVELAVAYGVADGPGPELIVGAVTLAPGATLRDRDLPDALARLDADSWPDVVRVVDTIPTSTWFRLLKVPLRAEGIPVSTVDAPVWRLDRTSGTYSKGEP
jgi:putative long chain acyl-CoA synthase